MRLTRLALAAAVVVAAMPAHAEDGEWFTFTGAPESSVTVAVHTGRLIEKGGRVTAWLTWTTSQGSFVEKREVDCAKKRSRELSTESNVPSGTWKEAPPESVMEGVVRFLCDHPPFRGWTPDPAREVWDAARPLVAGAIRRGDVLTRWEAKATTVQLVEYDCKGGAVRSLYFATRPLSDATQLRVEAGDETHSILSRGLRSAGRVNSKWVRLSFPTRICDVSGKSG